RIAEVTQISYRALVVYFFFQAEDGIRDWSVTGVQTCALPISAEDRGHGAQIDTIRKAAWATPLQDGRLAERALESLAGAVPPGGPGASNAWAVGAGRAARHAPLLANDTHLGLSTPGTWYAAHVVVPDMLDFIALYVPA